MRAHDSPDKAASVVGSRRSHVARANRLDRPQRTPAAELLALQRTVGNAAIADWRRTKTDGSKRDQAVTGLETRVRAALVEVGDRRRRKEEQVRLRGRYSVMDPRLEGYAVRANVDEVTVDPVNNKVHQALTDHDDQGRLTEQALGILDEFARQRLDDQLTIARQGQVTARGVTNDQIRRLMGRDTNEITDRTQYPELASYLANRGESDTDTANPADQEEVTRMVRDTQVTVHWDRTDALRERRIRMLEDAIRKVQEAGYPVPNLTAHLPKYGRQLTVTPEDVTEPPNAPKPSRAEFIAADNVVTSPEGVDNPLADPNRFLSTQLAPEGTGTIVHELGHFLHYQQNRGLFHDLNLTQFAPGRGRVATARSVSGYALKDPREFVAEVFLGRVYGRTFSDAVLEMYEALGGPEPSAAPGGVHGSGPDSGGG